MICPICVTTAITTYVIPATLSAVAAVKINQHIKRKESTKSTRIPTITNRVNDKGHK